MADLIDAHAISVFNGLARGFLLFTLAVGLSLIFGLMDVLNLAHGAVFLLGAYIGLSLAPDGHGFAVAAVAAVAVGLAMGYAFSAALAPLRGRGHLDQALLTLGLAFILSGGIELIWGSAYRSLQPPPALAGTVEVFGQRYPTYRLAVIGVGALIAVAVFLLFERTTVGIRVKATVADREMVSALGINVRRVTAGMLAVGLGLAAFAGVAGAPIVGVRPGVDWEVLVLALIVVVIGGLGSISGALIGSLLIGQVQSLGTALFPDLAAFLLFIVMAAVLLVRPHGLFGERPEA